MAFAKQIGGRLRGGEVIELVGDLGSGKTTFVRGIAEGAGSRDAVSSPSFTLTNQYDAKKVSIFHYDFYRLLDAGVLQQELAEQLTDSTTVAIVEWAAIVENVLPADRVSITINPTGDVERSYSIDVPQKFNYLFLDQGD